MGQAIRLANRGVVSVSGEEAQDFLQGLITNRVDRLQPGDAVYAGLLSPQGKLLFDFFVSKHGETFLFDVAHDLIDELVKRLTFYKLRAKVEISPLSDAVVGACWMDCKDLPAGAIAYDDPRAYGMGMRFIISDGAATDLETDETGWTAFRLSHAMPEGGIDYMYGDCFPHDIAMDQLNGIDFSKGCYVGQEVVSRMRHRGTARKRPMLVKASSELLEMPATIKSRTGSVVGEVRSAVANLGLAEIRVDRAASSLADSEGFAVDGVEVSLFRPDWADYAEDFDIAEISFDKRQPAE